MRLVELAHASISPRLKKGDICLDATAGNGHDSLFLAQHVSPGGTVYAVDIQESALRTTQERLIRHGLVKVLQSFHGSHRAVSAWLPASVRGEIAVAMFNLGYLPGGDHQVTTSVRETTAALEAIYPLIRKGGLISVIGYRGHPGGKEETEAVERLCKTNGWSTTKRTGSEKTNSPVLYLIEPS
jgi:predicted methyltransferase